MAFFTYRAKANDGKRVNGVVDAPSELHAARLLREKGYVVLQLKENKSTLASQLNFVKQFQRVSQGDVTNFTRQLATMVIAGLQLPDALSIIRKQTTNVAFAKVLLDLENQIIGGGNFADATSKYSNIFSPIYISLIRAGEASGNLDQILDRLADTLEAQREFQAKVKSAMIYPAIILIGMIIVIFIMMTVVVPKLSELYNDFGIALPFTTQILIISSNFMVRFWWLIIIGAIVGIYMFNKWRKTKIGERVMDTLILKVPIFGELQKKIILAEFTRTLSMLVASGIHLLNALQILKDSLGNVLFRDAVAEVSIKVERGFSLGDTFAAYPIFPPIVSQMMKVGEETGKLDETLSKLSKYFQTESEHLVRGLTAAIEPLIMVVLGVGVGFIVFSIITPIYNLTSQFK